MTYVGRVRVRYGDRITRLERLRAADAEYHSLQATFETSKKLWEASDKSRDERLHASIAVVTSLAHFASNAGMPSYAHDRVNDLLVALGELMCGRHSVLLAPSPVHPGRFSATDLMQQAIAQVCVDLLREAGAGAADARQRVSNLFEKHQLPKFSEGKLRTLNSRLKGPGSSQDEAYEMYAWARTHALSTADALGVNPGQNLSKASRLADVLIELTKKRDHRRDFFFAPGEDGSEVP